MLQLRLLWLSLRNRPAVWVQKRWCHRWLGRGCGHRRAPSTSSILHSRGDSPYHRRGGVRPAELPGSSGSFHDLRPLLRLHGRLLRQIRRGTGLLRRRLLRRRELVTLLREWLLLRLGLLLRRLLRLELRQPWRNPWGRCRCSSENARQPLQSNSKHKQRKVTKCLGQSIGHLSTAWRK